MKAEEIVAEIRKHVNIGFDYSDGKDKTALVFYDSDAEIILQALEKRIGKKPIHAHGNYYCPTCKDTWLLWDDAIPNESDNFCRYCGQRIWWGE